MIININFRLSQYVQLGTSAPKILLYQLRVMKEAIKMKQQRIFVSSAQLDFIAQNQKCRTPISVILVKFAQKQG